MNSYRQILYHIIFGTYQRGPTIDNENCEEFYKSIWGIIKKKNCHLYRINGVEDHIHILTDLHPSVALADLVKDIKLGSTSFIKQSNLFPNFRGWADGYAAFTYSIKEKNNVTNYIKKQKEHHKKQTFHDECVQLLKEHQVNFDENYLV